MKNFGTEYGTEGARVSEIIVINQVGVGFGLFSLPLRHVSLFLLNFLQKIAC
jgi:hypothetical protein